MSREQYQPPVLTNAGGQSSQQTSGPSGFSAITGTGGGASNEDNAALRAVRYLCGDCDSEVVLKKGDAIRCKECGYRVLYKQRTNRMIQFEAR